MKTIGRFLNVRADHAEMSRNSLFKSYSKFLHNSPSDDTSIQGGKRFQVRWFSGRLFPNYEKLIITVSCERFNFFLYFVSAVVTYVFV